MQKATLPEGDMRQALVTGSGEQMSVAETGAAQRNRPGEPVHAFHVLLVLGSINCMLMLYGYDFGITAWTVLNIKARGAEHLSKMYTYLELHNEVLGVLVACSAVGGTAGGIAGLFLDTEFGRKSEIQLVNMLCIVGAMLQGLTGTVMWDSVWPIFAYALGRLLYGFGLGLSLRCGPMYLREVVAAPARDRALVSIKLSMVVGMILSYVVGGIIKIKLYGYFGAAVIAVISLLFLRSLPESPQYMMLHEGSFTRTQVLAAARFTSPAATDADLQELEDDILRETLSYTPGQSQNSHGFTDGGDNHSRSTSDATDVSGRSHECITPVKCDRSFDRSNNGHHRLDLGIRSEVEKVRITTAEAMRKLPSLTKAPGMRASLLLTAGLMIFEQGSGMTALLYYAAVFFDDIDYISVDLGLALLGILQLVLTIVVIYSIDLVGRKPLVLYGVFGMAVSIALLASGAFLGLSTDGRWEALIGLYAFTAAYTVSLGAVVWVLISEVFPACHRAQAISIVSTAHFGTQAVTISALPLMQTYLSYSGMFCVFTAVAILANVFSHRYMIETKGLTIAEIQGALTKEARFTSTPPTR